METISVGRLIGELSRAANVYLQQEFSGYNIGYAQIRTLLYIAHNKGITQIELAQNLNLDKSSITSQLKILERNGYVERQTSKTDARKQVICITGKTGEILPSLQQVFSSWTAALLEGFNDEEIAEILSYLKKMKQNAGKKLSEIPWHNEDKG